MMMMTTISTLRIGSRASPSLSCEAHEALILCVNGNANENLSYRLTHARLLFFGIVVFLLVKFGAKPEFVRCGSFVGEAYAD